MSDHLPAGAKKYVMSFKADVIDPKTLIPEDGPVVLIVGAMAHGSVSIYTVTDIEHIQLNPILRPLENQKNWSYKRGGLSWGSMHYYCQYC